MTSYSALLDPSDFVSGQYQAEIIVVDGSPNANQTITSPITITISSGRGATAVPGVGRPEIVVEIAFGKAPFSSPGDDEWVDVTGDVLMDPGISVVSGASADNPTPTAGAVTLTLKDQDRRYDPENDASPYAGGLTFGCPLRVVAHYVSAVTPLVWGRPLITGRPLVGGGESNVPLGYGYIDGFPQTYSDPADKVTYIPISAPGALSVLARMSFKPLHPFTSAPDTAPGGHALVSGEALVAGLPLVGEGAYPRWMMVNSGAVVTGDPFYNQQERSGARIYRLCQRAGISDDFLDIDEGQTVVEGAIPQESNLLDHFRTVALTEGGRLFDAPDGRITFRERRPARQEANVPQANFCEVGGLGIPYASLQLDPADRRFLVNRCVRSSDSVGEAIVQDDASITKYGVFEDSQKLAFAFQEDAAGQARDTVRRGKEPPARINALTVKPDRAPDTMFPPVVLARVGTMYAVTRTPGGVGDPIVKTVFAEQVKHQFNQVTWETNIDLGEADLTHYFTLGVTGLDLVNAGNIVPY